MQKEPLILVHGVGAARWYGDAVESISPHFDCRPIDYEQYKAHGKLKVAFDFRLLMTAALIICLGGVVGYSSIYLALILAGAAILVMTAANVRARYSRVKFAMDEFRNDLHRKTGGARAHIIAHSFGTFLTGFLVQEIGHIHFGKIILAGSVLPRAYAWPTHRSRGSDVDPKFDEVRNDVGSRDYVGVLVRMFNPLMPDLGDSGRRGFETSSHVHTVRSSDAECASCRRRPKGIVHNVLNGFFHSSAVTKDHIENCWLPFLWEIPTHEYSDFFQQSVTLANLRRSDPREFRRKGQTFCERPWRWTAGDGRPETIVSYIEAQIVARLLDDEFGFDVPESVDHRRTSARLAFLATVLMWQLIAEGYEARRSGRDSDQIRMINPRVAAAHAAKTVVEFHRQSPARP